MWLNKFVDQTREVVVSLNALQLVTGILLFAAGWQQRDATNWFHIRYHLDSGTLARWSIVFTATICSDYFTESLLRIPATTAHVSLGLSLASHYRVMFLHDMMKKPNCYPPQINIDFTVLAQSTELSSSLLGFPLVSLTGKIGNLPEVVSRLRSDPFWPSPPAPSFYLYLRIMSI